MNTTILNTTDSYNPIKATVSLIGTSISLILFTIILTFMPILIIKMRKELSAHLLINLTSSVIGVIVSYSFVMQILIGWNGTGKCIRHTVTKIPL